MVHAQGSVHLVSGDVVEALAFELLRKGLPVELCCLKKCEGSHHVGPGECERVLDRAVHMGLCRKVDNAVHLLLLHELVEGLDVADIHPDKLVVRLVLDVLEVGKVAGISQLVEVDDLIFRIFVDK